MTLVIATAPDTSGDGLSVAEDVRLTRAGLLYADKVELWSPASSMLAAMASGVQGAPLLVLDQILELDDDRLRSIGLVDPVKAREVSETIRQYQSLSRNQRRSLPSNLQAAYAEATSTLSAAFNGENSMLVAIEDQWINAGGGELSEAADAGLLEVHSPDWVTADRQIEAYVAQLASLIEDSGRHMLFDEPTAELVAHLRAEGKVAAAPQALLNAQKAGAATRFIEYLQAFPDSTMASVISSREALGDQLIRYRRAVSRLSAKLDSEATDAAFEAEVEDIWQSDVQPALLDLREAVRNSRVAKDTAFEVLRDKATMAAGVSSVLILGVTGFGRSRRLGCSPAVPRLPRLHSGLVPRRSATVVDESRSTRSSICNTCSRSSASFRRYLQFSGTNKVEQLAVASMSFL
ncbi:hypothetical protein [Curtobacterium flaccumfaciens]|uniref:hypothetical protein n=1 Tax=Curtobacterium flaccumfaciens TaxID=2035 RepID=UPI0026587F0F|nr:hypothetical protein [Curtobacterium flaccumfaciens]MCS5519514.1 hypothetical protein [Curtobacterium flaccumfaciens]